MPNPRSLENLKPVQTGEVLNPKGRNQYTYRREAEEAFDRLVRKVQADGRTMGEVILEGLLEMARDRNELGIKLVIERLLPKVERREHDVEVSISVEQSRDALSARLARLAAGGGAFPGSAAPK